jgi:hypothetical protein
MDSPSKAGITPVSFMQEMLHNKFLLLTVILAVSATVYFCVALYALLSS